MKFIYTIFYILLVSKTSFSNNVNETNEYELKFTSENIYLVKEKKINEIKIKSFKNIIKKILTDENLEKINTKDIKFINKFILNFKINNEKIVNNNYYSKIKINFNIDLVFDYFIKNQIQFVDKIPGKFLIIILEQNELQNYLLSEENIFYKYLINSNNKLFNQHFVIPNLDYNDRFLFNKYHFENDKFNQNKLINSKYKTEYQILVHSKKKNNLLLIDIFLFHENKKYFITKLPINNLNYEKLFNNIVSKSLNKWKELNQIDPSLINTLECKININNIHELSYVRNLLKSNRLIQDIILKSIVLNQNLYKISYFGNIDLLKNSLQLNRLNLANNNNNCNIEII